MLRDCSNRRDAIREAYDVSDVYRFALDTTRGHDGGAAIRISEHEKRKGTYGRDEVIVFQIRFYLREGGT